MRRNLKTFGALVAAVFAITAVAASAAQAEPMFNSEAEETNLTATNTNVHHFSNGTFDVTCETASFTGSQSGTTATEVTIHPSYSNCHVVVFGFKLSATVNFTTCDYRFTADGEVHIVCGTEGDYIHVEAAGCNITIPEQSIANAATYSNNGSHVDVSSNATGIAYKQSGSTCGTKEGTNGSYTGDATVEGEDASTHAETAISWTE